MSRFPSVSRILYLVGVAIAYYAVWWERAITLTMTPVSATRAGKSVFVGLSRTHLNVRNITLAVLVLSQFFLFTKAFAINFTVLILLQAFQFANFYKRRVLTIANRGCGRWHVHLNALKHDDKAPNALWSGMSGELLELARFARAARVSTVAFDSPLLVDPTTARIVASRLDRIFGREGLAPNVAIEESKPMGAFKSGFIHPMRRYQSGLKANRIMSFASGELLTRRIEVNLGTVA